MLQGYESLPIEEMRDRQKEVLNHLGEDIFILVSGYDCFRNRYFAYPFRQESSFLYLTGFEEKPSVVVFDPKADAPVTIYVKDKIIRDEIWEGFATGPKKTKERYPVDAALNINTFEANIKKQIRGRCVHYTDVPLHPLNDKINSMISGSDATLCEEDTALDKIKEMRTIKSKWEINQIKQAVKLTKEAHHAAMQLGPKSQYEYELEAIFEYTFKRQGSRSVSFGTIIASGPNATCQHYVENNAKMNPEHLVLVDAGCEWNHYAADITRTWPLNGKFEGVQRDLYEVVLASEKAAVAMASPKVKMNDLYIKAAEVLIDGLKGLGLAHGNTEEIIENGSFKEFWPGGLSHQMGLDVHDISTPHLFAGADAPKTLQPGMVITIEPGFYSQYFNCQYPEQYSKIGIRVEDDILITEEGAENLSIDIVKEIDDIEAMVQSKV
jgi:Xaa-Pro aminopeptidase